MYVDDKDGFKIYKGFKKRKNSIIKCLKGLYALQNHNYG